ncbi:hypothetical protein QVD17_08654 [Tagetes erecta]|uniref:Uncharacterized protein n=1 Tax=Tagetes erecta TaxID=13708 RepID=A0AAD8KY62_TARER|nr:hypothetical protein QVD17_08654 [Tagetes erecta]
MELEIGWCHRRQMHITETERGKRYSTRVLCMYFVSVIGSVQGNYVGALRELLEQLAAERTPEGLPRSDFFAYVPDCFASN